MLYAFITDHGTQFDNQEFENYCIQSKIQKMHSAPGHPQCNNQIKVTNKTLLNGLNNVLMMRKIGSLSCIVSCGPIEPC